MVKSQTHFCDWCRREVWGEELRHYDGRDFCSDACIQEYAENEEVGF